jgi:hypothetical protein
MINSTIGALGRLADGPASWRISISRRPRPMTRRTLATVFVLATSLAGCDSPRPILPPAPPHGGTAFPLPQGKGFVEALRQDVPDNPGQTQLVIYFLDVECKPLTSAPTAASFLPKGRRPAPIALNQTGDTDPSKTGALATAPFSDPGDIAGTLSVTIDKKPVSISISIR